MNLNVKGMVLKSWVRCPKGESIERDEEGLEIGQEKSPGRLSETAQR